MVVFLGLVILALPASGWGSVLKISTHPATQYGTPYPQVAVDPSGNAYVTWQGSDENDSEIYWVKVDETGVPGTVKKISTHPDNIDAYDVSPQIAVDAQGNSYVVWDGWSGIADDIYWVKIDATGMPGTVKKISIYPDDRHRFEGLPQIAVDAQGNSYVVWNGIRSGYPNKWDIYWVKVDSSGVFETAQLISTHPDNIDEMDFLPQIAVDPSGNSYVTWDGWDGNDREIYWVKVDATSISGTVLKVSTHPDNINTHDQYPQIAVDSSGNSYVVWDGREEKSDGIEETEIYGVRVDAKGVPWAVQKISIHPDNIDLPDQMSRIAVDATGNFYLYGGVGTDDTVTYTG